MAAAARWSAACACLGVSRSEEAVLGHNNRLDSVPWSGVGTNTVGGYDHSRGRRHHCDRPGMLEAVRVARNQHADAPLHYERFSPPPVVDGVPFELELARSRRVLRVPANRSALDVMLDWDPTTAYSCQQGFCGTCKVRVLAGQVDRRGRIIEGDNEMLVCVSRAVSGRVVIDA